MLRRLLILITVVTSVAVAACRNESTTAPLPDVHIVTYKQPVDTLHRDAQLKIVLDQRVNWCSIEDSTVFNRLAVKDTVPSGTCQWYQEYDPLAHLPR